MNVELIFVGTELLLGNIVNTNAEYLSRQCAAMGLSCFYQTVVGDNENRLREVVEKAVSRADIVILSGGLGPTKDDLTKETVAKVLEKELIMDEAWVEWLKDYFSKLGREMTENNLKQALVPEGARVLANPNGTAPGILMEKDNTSVILLPGPPGEMIPMFEQSVAPYLSSLTPELLYSEMIKICGVGESKVETMILDLIESQSNPTIAPYAKSGEVHLRITAKADSTEQAKEMIKPLREELDRRFGTEIYSYQEECTLEQTVIEMLKKDGMKVSTIESCTGGMLAARLISVAGASAVMESGLVTYSNKAKEQLAGVDRRIIEAYGAVSEETAKAMALEGAKTLGVDACVSITGIAGPDGGSSEKPVGLVYIGCCVKGHVVVEKHIFSGERQKIRESSTSYALILLRKCLLMSKKRFSYADYEDNNQQTSATMQQGIFSGGYKSSEPKEKSKEQTTIILFVIIGILGIALLVSLMGLGFYSTRVSTVSEEIEEPQIYNWMDRVPSDGDNNETDKYGQEEETYSERDDENSGEDDWYPDDSTDDYSWYDDVDGDGKIIFDGKIYGYEPTDDYYYKLRDAIEQNLSYSIEWKYDKVTDDSRYAEVQICYPELQGEVKNLELINSQIKAVCDKSHEDYESRSFYYQEGDYYYEVLEGYVTYMSEDAISIVFQREVMDGIGYESEMICLNFDLEAGILMDNTKMLKMDEAFAEDFKTRCSIQNREDSLDDYSNSYVESFLQNQETLMIFYTPLGMEVGIELDGGYVTATYKDYKNFMNDY